MSGICFLYGLLTYPDETLTGLAPSFERRYRIYEISDYGETIQTWKRTESGIIVDEQILAGCVMSMLACGNIAAKLTAGIMIQ